MRTTGISLAVGLLALLASGADGQSIPTAAGQQWQSSFAREFNSGASDLSGFTYDVGGGGWGNAEKEVYTAPAGSPTPTPNPSGFGSQTTPLTGTNSGNVFVATDGTTGIGALHIDAIATGSSGSQTYTSGRIKTNFLFSQAFGLLEFRAKLPAGTGLWPALWMLPQGNAYGGWPTSGELDLLESKGQSSGLVQGSSQSGNSPGTLNTQTRTFSQSGLEPPGFSTGDWHTYDLQWTPGSANVPGTIKWYVDGVLYETQNGSWTVPGTAPAGDRDAPFDKPFYILMNLAVGGTYPGNPSLAAGTYEMLVDYMRVYESVYPGDANIDGKVDTVDFSTLAANFGGSGKTWSQGEFSGDGVVDTVDFTLLAANFAKQSFPGASIGGAGAVPEPGLMLVVAVTFGVMRFRRPKSISR